MNRNAVLCVLAWSVAATCLGGEPKNVPGFEKVTLTEKYYCDGIHAADIDRDGNVDIVAGPFWYAGPTFTQAREYYPAEELSPEAGPSNCIFVFAHDFNDDGWQDILVWGRVHLHPAYWYENPAKKEVFNQEQPTSWKTHFVFERVKGESPTLLVKENESPKLICHWGDRWGWVEPEREDAYSPWRFRPVSDRFREEIDQFYHGEGVGDVNGDGFLNNLTASKLESFVFLNHLGPPEQ